MMFTETTKPDRKSGGSREPALSEVEGDLQFAQSATNAGGKLSTLSSSSGEPALSEVESLP
jgi:hypothetical protein